MKINQPTEFQGKENFQREGKRMREDAGFIGETLWVSYKIQEHCLPNMKSSLLAFLNANSCSFYAGIRFGLAAQNIFGTDAGRVDRPNKFLLGHVSLPTVQNVKRKHNNNSNALT